MRDSAGNVLEIGNTVAFVPHGTPYGLRFLTQNGTIVGFTSTNVEIAYVDNTETWGIGAKRYTYRPPDELLRVADKPHHHGADAS